MRTVRPGRGHVRVRAFMRPYLRASALAPLRASWLPSLRVSSFALAALLTAPLAFAQGLAATDGDGPLAPTPGVPRVALVQRLGETLPLQAPFTDSAGRAIRLGDIFEERHGTGAAAAPVILVLGYYRCPQLCGLLTQDLLHAAHASGLSSSAWHLVFASIDPGDTPADAATHRRLALDYLRFLDGDGNGANWSAPALPAAQARQQPRPMSAAPQVDMLVGPPASIAALTRSVGYVYERTDVSPSPSPSPSTTTSTPASISANASTTTPTPIVTQAADPAPQAARFAHPAGILIVTPQGRVSRYLMGVDFDPQALRAALVEAGDGRVGSLSDRLALLCAHVDPHLGRWSTAVLWGLRGTGAATLALLALLLLRRRVRMPERPA